MSTKYKFRNPDGVYFVTFAVVEWVDVFTRKEYRDILIENLKYCQTNKGLEIFAWCIMSNHVHLIIRAKEGLVLQDILIDFKKFTSKRIFEAIASNPGESRKEWMVEIFREHGRKNSNNTTIQFWRQDNRPIEVFSQDVIAQKLKYLHNNPVEAGIVGKEEDYLYSSARDYFEGKNVGMLTLEWL
jgi:REP element-mobilizing transposase RayT